MLIYSSGVIYFFHDPYSVFNFGGYVKVNIYSSRITGMMTGLLLMAK